MIKCIKRIRDLFEYALYKFTLYLLTYLQLTHDTEDRRQWTRDCPSVLNCIATPQEEEEICVDHCLYYNIKCDAILGREKIVCTFEEDTCLFDDELALKERFMFTKSTVRKWDNTLNVGVYNIVCLW